MPLLRGLRAEAVHVIFCMSTPRRISRGLRACWPAGRGRLPRRSRGACRQRRSTPQSDVSTPHLARLTGVWAGCTGPSLTPLLRGLRAVADQVALLLRASSRPCGEHRPSPVHPHASLAGRVIPPAGRQWGGVRVPGPPRSLATRPGLRPWPPRLEERILGCASLLQMARPASLSLPRRGVDVWARLRPGHPA